MNTHPRSLQRVLNHVDTARVERWAGQLCDTFEVGGRLLTCGNGGSAAEAQHLTAELVGRFETERAPLSAIALHGDTSSVTAFRDDCGPADIYSRQVRAHGRPGDALLCLSTSGTSQNIVTAAATARTIGVRTWALTGRSPNTLAAICDDAVTVAPERTATVQQVHLALIHALCAAVDRHLERRRGTRHPTVAVRLGPEPTGDADTPS